MLREPSSYEARPSLGSSVDAVLRGWRGAAHASTAPSQCVRALLTAGRVGEWEFGWRNEVIHRIRPTGGSQPITCSEQEMLRRCMVHGWFFIYLAQEGQEPVVLHTVGIEVQDSPGSPLFSPLVTPESKSITTLERGSVEEIRLLDGETSRPMVSSPMQSGGDQGSAGTCPALPRLALLLLSGAVGSLGVIGWLHTRRCNLGMVLAVRGLVALGLTIKHAFPWR